MGLSENDGKKITPIEWLIIMSLLKWPYNWGSLIFRQIHSKFGHLGCLFHRNDAYLLPHTTPHEGQHGLHENLTHWTVVDGLML